jgi:hypothetical protein
MIKPACKRVANAQNHSVLKTTANASRRERAAARNAAV